MAFQCTGGRWGEGGGNLHIKATLKKSKNQEEEGGSEHHDHPHLVLYPLSPPP